MVAHGRFDYTHIQLAVSSKHTYCYVNIHSTTEEVRYHIHVTVSGSKMKRGVRSDYIHILKQIWMVVKQLFNLNRKEYSYLSYLSYLMYLPLIDTDTILSQK